MLILRSAIFLCICCSVLLSTLFLPSCCLLNIFSMSSWFIYSVDYVCIVFRKAPLNILYVEIDDIAIDVNDINVCRYKQTYYINIVTQFTEINTLALQMKCRTALPFRSLPSPVLNIIFMSIFNITVMRWWHNNFCLNN